MLSYFCRTLFLVLKSKNKVLAIVSPLEIWCSYFDSLTNFVMICSISRSNYSTNIFSLRILSELLERELNRRNNPSLSTKMFCSLCLSSCTFEGIGKHCRMKKFYLLRWHTPLKSLIFSYGNSQFLGYSDGSLHCHFKEKSSFI